MNNTARAIKKYHSQVKKAQDEYLKFADKFASLDGSEPEYRALMEGVLPGHIDHKAKLSKNLRKYDIGLSFKTQLSNYILEKKYLKELGITVAPPGNSKILDSKIFDIADIDSPKIFNHGCLFSESENYDEVVIKPTVGSNSYGVIIKKGSWYNHIYDGKVFNKEEIFRMVSKRFKNKSFLFEELLQYENGPARDFKVYCFYGIPKLILEVDRAHGNRKYCFYDNCGNIVDTGKYRESLRFEGNGVSDIILDAAKEVSLNIPAPFIRLDFLATDSGVYGGEVTSNPGLYYEFDHYWDRQLGIEFCKAKARLFKDVILGKKFSRYNEIMGNPNHSMV